MQKYIIIVSLVAVIAIALLVHATTPTGNAITVQQSCTIYCTNDATCITEVDRGLNPRCGTRAWSMIWKSWWCQPNQLGTAETMEEVCAGYEYAYLMGGPEERGITSLE